MHRRATRTPALILIAAATISLIPTNAAGAEATIVATPTTISEPAVTPITIADEFFPESANLSDCIGFLERPGCGAKGRSSTEQTMIFVVLAAGLAIIFWRIIVGVRRNRQQLPPHPGE